MAEQESIDQVGLIIDDNETRKHLDEKTMESINENDKTDAFGSHGASGTFYSTGTGAMAQMANGYANSTNYHKLTAKMTAERHAQEYNMRHKHRGVALIFNHEHFEVPTLKSRAGTNVDCENLERELKKLEFDVTVYKDLRLRELMHCIEKAANQDHSDNDCVLVAVLSHGELGYIYAKDTQYKLDTIWTYFTAQHCPTLAGKPKLFFVQACQGDRLDPGVTMRKAQTETDGESSSMSYKIPVHADFLIAYSTVPGFYSWRNTTRGSWFMQSLCAELAANGKKLDLLTLLTFVNQRVAVDFESCTPDNPEMHQQKQIPCITYMLTRILRFRDKIPPASAPAGKV